MHSKFAFVHLMFFRLFLNKAIYLFSRQYIHPPLYISMTIHFIFLFSPVHLLVNSLHAFARVPHSILSNCHCLHQFVKRMFTLTYMLHLFISSVFGWQSCLSSECPLFHSSACPSAVQFIYLSVVHESVFAYVIIVV